MKTPYYTASSLNGFLATEDDSIDWLFRLGSVGDTGYPDFIAEVGALEPATIPGCAGWPAIVLLSVP